MDPLTQGALGAAVAQCGSPKERMRSAALAGAAAGILPDADIFIRSPSDPLLFLDYHRHFTHSLAFIPVGAAAAAWLCAKVSRGRATPRELWWPCLLGYATHGLLDACTSYGTYLWWPLSNERVAWHTVSIIDPLFTLPLLIGVLWAARSNRRLLARTWTAVAAAYLALCGMQLERATRTAQELIADRGHVATRNEVKPSFGNNLVWRAFYEHEGIYYADAIRLPWFGPPKVYPGTQITALDRTTYNQGLTDLKVADLDRFEHFSAGWLIEDPIRPGVVSDFRYAMVPNAVGPLWGVDVAGTAEGDHLRFVQFNDVTDEMRATFLKMIRGEAL